MGDGGSDGDGDVGVGVSVGGDSQDDLIDRVNSENDVNELDKIFCDKNANSAASDNDDSRSMPGIEDSDIGDDITNDDQKDSSSLQASNTANPNSNLDSNVFSNVDHHHHHHHQQHEQQQQQHHQQQQHQEVNDFVENRFSCICPAFWIANFHGFFNNFRFYFFQIAASTKRHSSKCRTNASI